MKWIAAVVLLSLQGKISAEQLSMTTWYPAMQKTGGTTGNFYQEFRDVNNNQIGYMGYGSSAGNGLYLVNDIGNVALVTGPGYHINFSNFLMSGGASSLCYGTDATGYNALATCSSSRRYKEDIRALANDPRKVLELEPVEFKWKGRNERGVGLIAEEVEKVLPELATYKDGKVEGVEYKLLGVYLLRIIKSQDEAIRKLEKDVERLKSLNQDGAITSDSKRK